MGWFSRAKKTEVLKTIDGWGRDNPKDKKRTYSETDLEIGGKLFAVISHRQTATPDGTVGLTIFPGTGLPDGEPGSTKGHLRIARENMPSLSVASDGI